MAQIEDTKKVVVSRGIFFDKEGKILLVKINTSGGWVTPGGRVELNESPRSGLKREILEEIGLIWPDFEFRAVDFLPGKVYDQENGAICFMFYCGVIDDETKKKIILQDDELSGFDFFSADEAKKLMSDHGWRRMNEAILANKTKEAYYLEDGYKIGPAM